MPDQPAARVTDMHVCPMVTGLVPHVGGPILPPCEPTVITGNFMPQARISDMATCAGPPDVIAQGSITVTVRGLFAARQLDTTVHGGKIVIGWPTVLIGGPVFTARPVTTTFWGNFQYGSAITVKTDPDNPDYASQAIAALIRLDCTPTGSKIINAIEGSGNSVTIQPYDGAAGPYNATTQKDVFGDGSTVSWNPGVNGFGPSGTTPDWEQPGSDIILGHELIHAAHNATGTDGNGPQVDLGGGNTVATGEERNTTGLPAQTFNGAYNDTSGNPLNGTALPNTQAGAPGQPYTENQLRNDYSNSGVPSPVTGNTPEQRPSYFTAPAGSGPGTPGTPF